MDPTQPPPPHFPPPDGSAHGVATSAAANAALLAAAHVAPEGDNIARSSSAGSHHSNATSSGGRSSTVGGGSAGAGSAASRPGDAFRTSPPIAPPPLTVIPNAGAALPFRSNPETAAPPPPWPPTTASQEQDQPLHPPPMAESQYPLQSSQQPQQLPPGLTLSMTKSADTLFSVPSGNSAGVATPSSSANATHNSGNSAAPLQNSITSAPTADSSVLLGLEELERQQAHAEERRAQKLRAEQQQQQQQQQPAPPPLGLPPLPPRPVSAPSSAGNAIPPAAFEGVGVSSDKNTVPAQINLVEEKVGRDEDTFSSCDDVGGMGGDAGKDMKRVVSIEKLRGSVSGSLRRFRSWSQDALARSSVDPVANSSVDSTQNSGSGMEEGIQPMSPPQQRQLPPVKSTSKKLQTDSTNVISEPFLDDEESKPLVYGYLHKFGRNGHWQKRFFETNGECLTYYKSVKRTKVLATLDLCKVGEIAIDKSDTEECTFTIAVKNRPYYLRAEDKARCNDWVIILNRAREARMHVGNIQLAASGEGRATHPSQPGDGDYAPCIVISALRPRTRAVMDLEEDKDLHTAGTVEGAAGGIPDLLTSNTAIEEEQIEVMAWEDRLGQHSQEVVGVVGGRMLSPPLPAGGQSHAKWQKRHSYMHLLSLRFLKWARSITNQADACRKGEEGSIVIPAHVVMAAQQMVPAMAAHAAQPAVNKGREEDVPASEAAPAVSTPAENPQLPPQQQERDCAPDQVSSGDMPALLEEAPPLAPSAGVEDNIDESQKNRSRSSTESSAFGSTYV